MSEGRPQIHRVGIMVTGSLSVGETQSLSHSHSAGRG